VYSLDGSLYQCEYTISDGTVSLGDEIEVQVSYVPVGTTQSESKETKDVTVKGDLIQLVEKAVSPDGTARIKLINPGWGSSGYYSKEMLKRDGPKAFKKGTHMYMNHPTEEEDRVRPERDVRDLAGVISSDVIWEDASSKNTGEGLYADVKVFPTYREFIDEAAPHIGVSIRASGTAVEGQAENRHGLLVDSLTEGFSVDYVTMAGRGGQVLSLYESARSRIVIDETTQLPNSFTVQEATDLTGVFTVDITEAELNSLREAAQKTSALETALAETQTQLASSNTMLSRMQEAMLLTEAQNTVNAALATIQLPDMTRARLATQCANNPPLKEDKTLDKDKLIEAVKEAAIAEMQYLESVTGRVTGGQVTGMTAPATTELTEADVNKSLEDAWGQFGLNEKEVNVAVNGRR
jgi:hypothetical protein